MAKRKSKSNNSSAVICSLICITLSVIGILLFMFLPFMKASSKYINANVVYSGPGCIFGGTINYKGTIGGYVTSSTIKNADINVVGLIAFIVAVLGILLNVFILFIKKKNDRLIVSVLSGIILVIAGIMMFATKDSFLKVLGTSNGSLQVGPIVGGILTLASGAISAAVPFVR